ncbi:casparian strip membrane protein 3-like [Cornus florida]|uniref:casparian strip membrane protein 3-like n=1 Tax=Cornus florida TaxID=4283 RepID=UPI0028981890|nr:casparian strip membrane protein 3-like [Cornus florida]
MPLSSSMHFLLKHLLKTLALHTYFLKKMKAGTLELGEASKGSTPQSGVNRGVSILDFILRLIAIIGTLGSAVAMGTTDQTLPFVTQFIRFRADFDDFPAFMFFVIVNSIVCAYLALSLALSIFHIVRSSARPSRIFLICFDSAMLALLTAGASAAAAIVYLAHKGNAKANWFALCQQFQSFCERTSGSLIGSFGGILVFILLILLSAVALSRP